MKIESLLDVNYRVLDSEPESVDVERTRYGEGTFILVRFRNKKDLLKFSEMTHTPEAVFAKAYSRTPIRVEWSSEKLGDTTLESFLG